MKQYLDLLKTIKEKGTYKPAARQGMPGTQSLFGYQFRHNLADGFPLLTTKKMFWKGVVIELLWFLRGDTNIAYLIENGVKIWNEDAYNYYLKQCKRMNHTVIVPFETFINEIKVNGPYKMWQGYRLGDCGFQYGKVWRSWVGNLRMESDFSMYPQRIDQIHNVYKSLLTNPEGRRHIITAIDPANDDNLALYWCHCMVQFNCRPLTMTERYIYINKRDNPDKMYYAVQGEANENLKRLDELKAPKYYLDCQLYQRSADVVLGVPFNIASYALLTEIMANMVNMIPGEFIHTFGDVHIYDNHKEAVEIQLSRNTMPLPTLKIAEDFFDEIEYLKTGEYFNYITHNFKYEQFTLENYNSHPAIKAELSTGMVK